MSIHFLFEDYKKAVFEKNADAFLSLYHSTDFVGFDLWEEWVKTPSTWKAMVHNWFSSLGTDRVQVEFDSIQEKISGDLSTAHAIGTFTAISPDGKNLRSLQNRITWIARKENGVWRIIHEHTSAPVNHETLKVILEMKKVGK